MMSLGLVRTAFGRITALVLSLTVTAIGLPLSGCGGGTVTPPASSIPTVTPLAATGTVDMAEIGGGGLVVLSALAEPAGVTGAGAFSTRVSDIGAQALFAVDSSGELRGLALSVPGGAGASARSTLAVDAETTALGLLFMVPGITALDPTAARGRIAELRGYDSFTAFASFLREHLPTEGLAGLNTDGGEYQNLYEACVLEWMRNHPTSDTGRAVAAATKLQVKSPEAAYCAGMDVTCPSDPATWPKAEVTISNAGWRFADIRRRDLKDATPTGWTAVAADLSAMQGVGGFTWGSLFTASFANANSKTETVDFTTNTQAEYWVRGPGFKQAYATMPGGAPGVGNDPLTAHAAPAWGVSIVMYLVMPIISLVSGIGEVAKVAGSEIMALAGETWQTVSASAGGADLLLNVLGLIGSTDTRAQAKAVVDTVIAIVGAIASTPAIAAALGLTAHAATVATALGVASAPLCLANATICVGAWSGTSWCTRFDVRRPTYGIIVKAYPSTIQADGRTLSTITATVRNYSPDQDPSAGGDPTGDPVPNVKLSASTSLGFITESQSPTYSATTDPSGEATFHLLSLEKGEALVVVSDDPRTTDGSTTVVCTDKDVVEVTSEVVCWQNNYTPPTAIIQRYSYSCYAVIRWDPMPGVDTYLITPVRVPGIGSDTRPRLLENPGYDGGLCSNELASVSHEAVEWTPSIWRLRAELVHPGRVTAPLSYIMVCDKTQEQIDLVKGPMETAFSPWASGWVYTVQPAED